MLSQWLSSSEVKKGEYCIEYRRDSIVNSMINQKPFYFNNESKLQLSGLWKGLNKFNRGFAEALIYNLKDTTVKQRAKPVSYTHLTLPTIYSV